MKNPFQSLHESGRSDRARNLARAFLVCHSHFHGIDPWEQLHAICRFERRVRMAVTHAKEPSLSDYLSGSHFADWQDDRCQVPETSESFASLREQANHYMGQRV